MDEKDIIRAQVAELQIVNLSRAYVCVKKERKLTAFLLKTEDERLRKILYEMIENEHGFIQEVEKLFHMTGRSLDLDLCRADILADSQESAPDGPSEDS